MMVALFMSAALIATYWNHFDNAFHFDDSHTIVENNYITDIANLPLFFTDARTSSSLPTNQAYRPMVTTLNAFDYWLAGRLDPRVFHWHIFIEFLLLLAVMFLCISRLFEMSDGQGHPYVALLATAFFAFHTATAETINYIIARSDGFSTLMVLAGMSIYMHTTSWKRQFGLIPFIIGSLAKPTTLMLAPLLAIYSLMLERPSLTVNAERGEAGVAIRRAIRGTIAYFVVGIVMYAFTRGMFPETWSPSNHQPLDYLNTQPYVIWVYLKTFVLPTDLTADTDLQIITEWFAPGVIWGLVVIAALLAGAWVASRRRTSLPIAFGILWFFIALAPSSSFVPLAEVMNHHRTFFPYIGLVMAITWAIFLLVRKYVGEPFPATARAATAVFSIVVLGVHAYGTYQRNEVWDSSLSLWRDVAAKSPDNGRGLMNYGLALMRQGDMEGALDYYRRALHTGYGRHPYLYINLGIATNELSDRNNAPELKKEAEAYFRRALELGPNYPECHYRYAEWLFRNGRAEEAVPHLQRALDLAPANKGARELLEKITNPPRPLPKQGTAQ